MHSAECPHIMCTAKGGTFIHQTCSSGNTLILGSTFQRQAQSSPVGGSLCAWLAQVKLQVIGSWPSFSIQIQPLGAPVLGVGFDAGPCHPPTNTYTACTTGHRCKVQKPSTPARAYAGSIMVCARRTSTTKTPDALPVGMLVRHKKRNSSVISPRPLAVQALLPSSWTGGRPQVANRLVIHKPPGQ
jgi:hypothetical protein